MKSIDDAEFLEHAGITAVMGEFVMVLAATAATAGFAGPFVGDDARGVGDEGEVRQFQHDVDPHGTVMSVAGLHVELDTEDCSRSLERFVHAANNKHVISSGMPRGAKLTQPSSRVVVMSAKVVCTCVHVC